MTIGQCIQVGSTRGCASHDIAILHFGCNVPLIPDLAENCRLIGARSFLLRNR